MHHQQAHASIQKSLIASCCLTAAPLTFLTYWLPSLATFCQALCRKPVFSFSSTRGCCCKMQDSHNACGWQEQKEVEVPLSPFAFVCFHAETGKQELASVPVDGMGERAQEQTHWSEVITPINQHSLMDASWRSRELWWPAPALNLTYQEHKMTHLAEGKKKSLSQKTGYSPALSEKPFRPQRRKPQQDSTKI